MRTGCKVALHLSRLLRRTVADCRSGGDGFPLQRGAVPLGEVGGGVVGRLQELGQHRVRVGRGAHLNRCIVADDVVIPAGMQYDRMVITRDSIMPL